MLRIWVVAAVLLLQGSLVYGAEIDRAAVDGGQIEYEVRGEGEPVLLIHGAHIADAFAPLMDESALEDYQLIRYRRRGYAGSAPAEGPPEGFVGQAAADAVAVLDHLGIDRAHIAGHSSGGTIGLQLAMDYPERVGSLLLLEPALLMVPSGERFGEKLQPSFDDYEVGKPGAAVDSFMTVVAGNQWREFTSASMPGAAEQARADAATVFELEAPGVMAWQLDEGSADAFDRPVLYLWGGQSGTVIGVEEVYREGRDLVKSWLPQTQEHYIEGINHALQMQDPQVVAEGMAEFLQANPLP